MKKLLPILVGCLMVPTAIADSQSDYYEIKEEATVANRRLAAAWRRIPANQRNRLQQSISYLPNQIAQKCCNYSNNYDDYWDKKVAYLSCSIKHEDMVSEGIEEYSDALIDGFNVDFFDYVHPKEIINSSI